MFFETVYTIKICCLFIHIHMFNSSLTELLHTFNNKLYELETKLELLHVDDEKPVIESPMELGARTRVRAKPKTTVTCVQPKTCVQVVCNIHSPQVQTDIERVVKSNTRILPTLTRTKGKIDRAPIERMLRTIIQRYSYINVDDLVGLARKVIKAKTQR